MAQNVNMERRQMPNELSLSQALKLIDHDSILQFTGNEVRRYEIIETGETRLQEIKAGETEYVFRAPVREPLLRDTYYLNFSLNEAEETEDEATQSGPIVVSHELTSSEALAWKLDFHEPETVIAAARERLELGSPENDTVACGNCKGAQTFHLNCSCLEGGVSFIDMADGGDTESLRPKGEPDTNCTTCNGSGSYDNPCPVCAGGGTEPRNAFIKLINDKTGSSEEIQVDTVRLIASEELIIEKSGYEYVDVTGWERSEWRLKLKLGQWLTERFVDLGVDTEHALFVTPFGAREHWVNDPWAEAHYYSRRPSDTEAKIGDYNHHPDRESYTPDYILSAFEKAVSHHFRPLFGQDIAPGEPFPYPLRPLPDAQQSFLELKGLLEANNLTLGYQLGFIATEEYGPSFLIMDRDGLSGSELASSYTVEAALDNALERARELFSKRC